ncbi:MAG: hypothetical protein KME31_14410 [Tolypothrix carrinoi HA7290-LM1]|nr:hypothetical protein [Tolypothrix carrinoi HA7290-LM1]
MASNYAMMLELWSIHVSIDLIVLFEFQAFHECDRLQLPLSPVLSVCDQNHLETV